MLGDDLDARDTTPKGGDMTDHEDRVPCQRCGQNVPRNELQGGRCPGCVANDY
jgi:Zn finger protein HypA/HybF involved in hydrogenase expression